jgi:uncharacterized membrane protein
MPVIYGMLVAAHWMGVVLWLGGACAAASVGIHRAKGGGKELERLEREFLFLACHPGMLLAILSGAGMIALNASHFLQEGWLLAKLFLAAVLIALTIAVTAARRAPSAPKLNLLRAAVALAAFLVLLLAALRPF